MLKIIHDLKPISWFLMIHFVLFYFFGMVELRFFITALSNEAINIYNIWHEWSQQVLNVWKSPKSGAHPADFTGIAPAAEFVSLCVLFTMMIRGPL